MNKERIKTIAIIVLAFLFLCVTVALSSDETFQENIALKEQNEKLTKEIETLKTTKNKDLVTEQVSEQVTEQVSFEAIKGKDFADLCSKKNHLEIKTKDKEYSMFDANSYTAIIKVDSEDNITNIELDINKESDEIDYFELINNLYEPNSEEYNNFNSWLKENFKNTSKESFETHIGNYDLMIGYNNITKENSIFVDKK